MPQNKSGKSSRSKNDTWSAKELESSLRPGDPLNSTAPSLGNRSSSIKNREKSGKAMDSNRDSNKQKISRDNDSGQKKNSHENEGTQHHKRDETREERHARKEAEKKLKRQEAVEKHKDEAREERHARKGERGGMGDRSNQEDSNLNKETRKEETREERHARKEAERRSRHELANNSRLEEDMKEERRLRKEAERKLRNDKESDSKKEETKEERRARKEAERRSRATEESSEQKETREERHARKEAQRRLKDDATREESREERHARKESERQLRRNKETLGNEDERRTRKDGEKRIENLEIGNSETFERDSHKKEESKAERHARHELERRLRKEKKEKRAAGIVDDANIESDVVKFGNMTASEIKFHNESQKKSTSHNDGKKTSDKKVNEEDDYNYDEDFEDYDEDFEDEDDEEAESIVNNGANIPTNQMNFSDSIIKADDAVINYFNFSAAKRSAVNSKTYQRSIALMSKIELDVMSLSMFELAPLSEYDVYMKRYGMLGAVQQFTQTGDSDEELSTQTDEIIKFDRWTQHPYVNEATGSPDDTKSAFEDKSEFKFSTNSRKLQQFLDSASILMLKILEQAVTSDGSKFNSKHFQKFESEMLASKRLLNNDAVAAGLSVTGVALSPGNPDLLVVSLASRRHGGLLVVWHIDESNPRYQLSSKTVITCCAFTPTSSDVIIGGGRDGSVSVWNASYKNAQCISTRVVCSTSHSGEIVSIQFESPHLFICLDDLYDLSVWLLDSSSNAVSIVQTSKFSLFSESTGVGSSKSQMVLNGETIYLASDASGCILVVNRFTGVSSPFVTAIAGTAAVAVSPHAPLIAVGDCSGTLAIYHLEYRCSFPLASFALSNEIIWLEWFPSNPGVILAVTSDEIYILDIVKNKKVQTIIDAKQARLNANGQFLAVVLENGDVAIYRLISKFTKCRDIQLKTSKLKAFVDSEFFDVSVE